MKKDEMTRYVARMGESSRAHIIFVPKPERERKLRRSRRVILKLMFEKQGLRMRVGFIWANIVLLSRRL
jgi:hypothetical protein